MTVKQILKIKDTTKRSFTTPHKNMEATEDYATKKVIQAKEITLSDGAGAGFVKNDANGVLTGGNAGASTVEGVDVLSTGIALGSYLRSNGDDTSSWVAVEGAGVTDHTLLSNIGTNTHAQIDTHLSTGSIHFTEASISIPASQISDFDTEVSNNIDVAANTSARHNSGSDTTLGAMTADINMNSNDIKNVKSMEVQTNGKIEFRDGEIYIQSNADGEMTIEADTQVNITAPTIVGDHTATGSVDQVVNVCYGTGSDGPTASTTTEGALYIQYED